MLNNQSQPRLIRVFLATPLRRGFDYLLPAGLDAQPGMRVQVPFGRGRRLGVVGELDVTPDVETDKLKAVEEVLDAAPLLPDSLQRLVRWAADYYLHSMGDVWQQALPVLLRQGAPADGEEQYWQLTAAGQEAPDLKNAAKQQLALARLRQGELSDNTLAGEPFERAQLRALADKGLAQCHSRHHKGSPFWERELTVHPGPRPNPEQAVAITAINQASGFQPFLLEGVTGSGKTEVYLSAMAEVLKAGKQVLVLVPEISLTPQTLRRFQKRFDVPMALLHSGLTDNERLAVWRQARDGELGIVIGTRSAVFTPLARPGLIVVDEEHDASFKQQEGFRYHGRDLAVVRAQLEKVPLVLGSATPALESLANCEAGKYRKLVLGQRAGGASQVRFDLLDIKHQPLKAGLCPQALGAIEAHLKRGEQVLVFLNRRGYAPTLLCHECGWLAACPRCSAYPTVHKGRQRLICHHCGTDRPLPHQCQECGSSQLVGVGLGTEQLETELAALFPDYPLVRIDRDATRRKGSLESALDGIREGRYKLLVGTQMLAKGHHFPDVTLVVLLDVDGALYSADFRAAERLAQLVVQVAGRAGRADKPGRLLLQSHHPEHPLLSQLLLNGYQAFAADALIERRQTMLPPYSAQALFRAESLKQEDGQSLLEALAQALQQSAPEGGWALGPLPAPLERRAGKFRFQLWVQCPDKKQLRRWLSPVLSWLETAPPHRRANWSLDLDPVDSA
ncbi:primosomal protein N' [Gallaecimonas kandeliae]|uniref:primosomal protein N' n=1 Tax=Gallaecimonas kandeliae TaxID=3029055 RepID=UPI0026491DF1|nr:primosomal protein N' [Gallaecimonas kandeliae]WKE65331.1 primosomal protein N' [Gallaecimonas kandeliae]